MATAASGTQSHLSAIAVGFTPSPSLSLSLVLYFSAQLFFFFWVILLAFTYFLWTCMLLSLTLHRITVAPPPPVRHLWTA